MKLDFNPFMPPDLLKASFVWTYDTFEYNSYLMESSFILINISTSNTFKKGSGQISLTKIVAVILATTGMNEIIIGLAALGMNGLTTKNKKNRYQ